MARNGDRSGIIRNFDEKHPGLSPKEAAQLLLKAGHKGIDAALVSNVRSYDRRAKKARRAKVRALKVACAKAASTQQAVVEQPVTTKEVAVVRLSVPEISASLITARALLSLVKDMTTAKEVLDLAWSLSSDL